MGDKDVDLRAAQRRFALMEEALAASHERAAALYESWVHGTGPWSAGELDEMARRHRESANSLRSVSRMAAEALGMFEERVMGRMPKASAKARYLAMLTALDAFQRLIAASVDRAVGAARAEGATWAEIAAALHVTRQSAHERYRGRDQRAVAAGGVRDS